MTAGSAAPGRRWGLAQIALVLPWVAIVAAAFRPIRDNSFLWHIRAGDAQIASGAVLTVDPFSFTRAGEPWLTQSWLADLIYGWLHGIAGLGFVGWMVWALAAVTICLTGVLVYRTSHSITATASILVLTSMLLLPVMVPRPVIFSFPLFVAVILAWENPQLRWSLPFLFWVWASVHGGFFVGLLYIFLRWLSSREWRAWTYGLASGVATLLTAHGLGTVTTVSTFLSLSDYLELMQEWQTPDFLALGLMPFMLGLLVIIVGAMRGRVTGPDFWVLVPFLVLALSANRGVLPAWLALLPIVAAALTDLEWNKGRGFPQPVALTALVLILALPLPFVRPAELAKGVFPVAAAGHLLDERTFHEDGAGGYFIYKAQFSEGVYVDDRVELYREGMEEFVEIRAGRQDWRIAFKELGIGQALVPTDGPLHRLLAASGWKEYFRDSRYSVLRAN